MGEHIPRESEEWLAAALKVEADASRPEFSEKLHERICRAVRQSEARPTPLSDAMQGERRRSQAVATAVTIVVLLLAAWCVTQWQPPGSGLPTPVIVENTNDEPATTPDAVDPLVGWPPLAEKARDLDSLVATTMTAQRWGYLDEDARTATRLLIDQLPQFGP
ncbi:MAG: hypothetical protein HQ567_03220 [Candidatus Nealsonbacteria bacterium]|nr:hypothetical protein [Candidatus Nealsonbacteria bacterium]